MRSCLCTRVYKHTARGHGCGGIYDGRMTDLILPHTDLRRVARSLYWQGWSLTAIAEHIGEKYPTVASWKRRGQWDETLPLNRTDEALDARLQMLIALPNKGNGHYKEIDALTRAMERTAKTRKFLNGGNLRHLSEGVDQRVKAAAEAGKWEISEAMIDKLRESIVNSSAKYQLRWWAAREHRFRLLIKSRQIGATWFFAREALLKSFETGKNQIFLSASKAQAHIFKRYIVAFARSVLDIDLKGDPIVLPNEAQLFFLGTNANTAQGYNGDVYMDEAFWIRNFKLFNDLAGAMASHKQFTRTYISTPSFVQHEAYPFFINDRWAKKHKTEIDVSHANLRGGKVGPDGRWREICSIDDAREDGCELFDFDELRDEIDEDVYQNLYLCQFMDDSHSEFPVQMLLSCLCDSWEEWTDFSPFSSRPYAHKPVTIGYDPAISGDNAGVTVLTMPTPEFPEFRVLEKHKWHGTANEQAKRMRDLVRRFNVVHIGVDSTGIGATFLPLVREFFPTAVGYKYSPDVKFHLVQKTKDVITKGRLKFDHRDKDIVSAFNSVQRRLTASGRSVTFEATRKGNDHADIAWSIMHALMVEPMSENHNQTRSYMEIL